LSGLRRGLLAAQFAQLAGEALAHRLEARGGEDAEDLGVEVGDGMDGGGVGPEGLAGPPVAEMLEAEVLDVMDEVLVAGMDAQLFEDLDEDEAEDELHGQVAPL